MVFSLRSLTPVHAKLLYRRPPLHLSVNTFHAKLSQYPSMVQITKHKKREKTENKMKKCYRIFEVICNASEGERERAKSAVVIWYGVYWSLICVHRKYLQFGLKIKIGIPIFFGSFIRCIELMCCCFCMWQTGKNRWGLSLLNFVKMKKVVCRYLGFCIK